MDVVATGAVAFEAVRALPDVSKDLALGRGRKEKGRA